MRESKLRAEFAADQDLGAGNVLSTLIARDLDVDRPAITFDVDIAGQPAWQPMTLRQLDERVAARAAWLHQHGVRPRDPFAVYTESGADHIISFLALTRIGAIPALINGRLATETAAAYIRRLRAVGAFADPGRLAELRSFDPGTTVYGLDQVTGARPQDAPAQYRFHPEDPVAITHSSGTTGIPKAVVHSHHSLFAAVRHRMALPRARGMERVLAALPTPHAAGVITLNLALCNGSELLVLSRQTGAATLDAIERWQPSAIFGFSTTWSDLARFDLGSRKTDSVQVWFNTGDCAHEAHVRRLVAVGSRPVATAQGIVHKRGSAFVDGLGSTEMGHSYFHITHTPETNRYGRCIGRKHTFVEVAVLNAVGDPLPAGVVGQLGVRSAALAPGYWNDSVTTYRSRLRGWFLTGDLAYRDEEGYYYHVDRAVDAVDLGNGAQLYTAMSEERVLAGCPDVLDCTVVAIREGDQVSTDVLLVLAAGADPGVDRLAAVKAALDESVAATVRNVVVVSDDQIPLGPTGKVRKFMLREWYAKDGLRSLKALAR